MKDARKRPHRLIFELPPEDRSKLQRLADDRRRRIRDDVSLGAMIRAMIRAAPEPTLTPQPDPQKGPP